MNWNDLFGSQDWSVLFKDSARWALQNISNIIIAFVLWKIGKILVKMLLKITGKALYRANVEEGVIKFISSILKIVAYIIVMIVILDVLGFETTSLIAVFGSAALAVSMSLQGSLSNFAGGILIMVFKPFKVGDYIVAQNCEGTVESIEILYTKLKTIDNKAIMMPNGTLSNSNIVNVGAEGVRRLDIEIGISYTSDVTLAKNILRDLVDNYPSVKHDKEKNVILKSLDSSCVLLEARFWVSQEAYWDTKFVLLERIKMEFDKNGIEIPYNKLDVNVYSK